MKRVGLKVLLATLSGVFFFGVLRECPILAQTIKGGVSKAAAIDTAKSEAFQDIRPLLDMTQFSDIDPNYIENKATIIRKRDIVGDRLFTFFEDGSYSVSGLCAQRTLYYYPDGHLTLVEEETAPTYYDNSCAKPFPKKSYKYQYPSGRLVGVSVDVSKFESFVFTPDGALTFHWVGNKCYNSEGKRCGNRRSFRQIPTRKKSHP